MNVQYDINQAKMRKTDKYHEHFILVKFETPGELNFEDVQTKTAKFIENLKNG